MKHDPAVVAVGIVGVETRLTCSRNSSMLSASSADPGSARFSSRPSASMVRSSWSSMR
jgi:hypothetical protein